VRFKSVKSDNQCNVPKTIYNSLDRACVVFSAAYFEHSLIRTKALSPWIPDYMQ